MEQVVQPVGGEEGGHHPAVARHLPGEDLPQQLPDGAAGGLAGGQAGDSRLLQPPGQ